MARVLGVAISLLLLVFLEALVWRRKLLASSRRAQVSRTIGRERRGRVAQAASLSGSRTLRLAVATIPLNQVTATLSVELNGSPAGFQIRVDNGGLMQPGAVRFVPAGPHDSFSFIWVVSVSPFEANDHHVFDVEWRSPTGRATKLERASLNLQYKRGTQRC
jgi:hypothetical protein